MKTSLFWLSLFGFLTATAQTPPFETIISEPGSQISGIGSIQLPDGSIYMAGGINSDTTVGTDILFVKMDMGGTIEWSKSYNFGKAEVAYDFIFKDEKFIIVGETVHPSPFDRNGFILQLDIAGNLIDWEESGSPSKSEQYYSVSAAGNGFVIAGHITAANGIGNDVLVRYQGLGMADAWEKIHGAPVNDIGIAAEQLVNGNFLVVGDRQVEPDKYNPFAMILDLRGELIHDKVIESAYNGGCKNLLLINDSEAIVVGEMSTPTSSSFDIILAKVDTTAETLWLNFVPATEMPEAGFGICRVNSGSFFITGYGWNEETNNSDIMVASVDEMGNVTDRAFFGGPGLDLAYDIKPFADGGFLCTGKSGNGGGQDAIVVHGELELANAAVQQYPAASEIHLSPNLVISGGRTLVPMEWADSRFQYFDISGKLIKSGALSGNELQVNAPPGRYLVHFILGTESGVASMVVY